MICQCGPLNFLALTSSDNELCCDKTFSSADFSPTMSTEQKVKNEETRKTVHIYKEETKFYSHSKMTVCGQYQ